MSGNRSCADQCRLHHKTTLNRWLFSEAVPSVYAGSFIPGEAPTTGDVPVDRRKGQENLASVTSKAWPPDSQGSL